MNFPVLPHRDAPLFPSEAAGVAVFKQLLVDVALPGAINSEEVKEVLRQAGLVNLWFFLKFIAGATGPFHFLNTGVHKDMCDFRQSETCMRAGAKVAVFLPRGFAKTTIFTEGALAWELNRDPNQRFRIVNATIGRAARFKNVVQRVFDSNPMTTLLFPATKPLPGARRWNETEMVMSNATRLNKEASLSAGGVEGASEGDHFDVLQMDDIVGMDDVDANFNAGLSMESAIIWFAMHETLLNSRMTSRSFVVATRYGPGDVYTKICDNVRAVYGFNNNSFKIKSDGAWDVYYRHAIENGVAVNPFVITAEAYAKLLRDEPLVAAYQYANDVTISIMNEFAAHSPKRCSLQWGEKSQEYWLVRDDEEKDSNGDAPRVKLSECTICVSCDWAGSDHRKSIRTSRSSIGMWAKDSENRVYRFDQNVGYYAMPDVIDRIFALHVKWAGYSTATLLEANAMQKGIYDMVVADQTDRGIFMNIRKRNAVGNKVVRIRTTIGTYLHKGLLYLTDATSLEFNEERLAFPSPRLDVLDESEKALTWLTTPEGEKDRQRHQNNMDDSMLGCINTGSDAEEQSYGFDY